MESIFPSICYKCGKYGAYLCNECIEVAEFYPTCPHCGIRLPQGVVPKSCRNHIGVNRIYSTGNYNTEYIGNMIKDMKYKRAYALSHTLAGLISKWIKDNRYPLPNSNTLIVPAPMHKKDKRIRGFNHTEKIAKVLSEEFNITENASIIMKTKKTTPQANTNTREERKENLKDAFYITDPSLVKGKTVLFIDDVITTGSTIRECAKILREAGAKEVWGIAVAQETLN